MDLIISEYWTCMTYFSFFSVVCGIIAFLCLLGTLIDLCLIQQSWKFWLTSENVHAESYPPPQEKTALLGAEANGESTPLLRSNVSASHSVSAPNIRFTQPNRKLEGNTMWM